MTLIRHIIQTKFGASHDSLCSPVCVGIHDLSARQYFFIVCLKKDACDLLLYTTHRHYVDFWRFTDAQDTIDHDAFLAFPSL